MTDKTDTQTLYDHLLNMRHGPLLDDVNRGEGGFNAYPDEDYIKSELDKAISIAEKLQSQQAQGEATEQYLDAYERGRGYWRKRALKAESERANAPSQQAQGQSTEDALRRELNKCRNKLDQWRAHFREKSRQAPGGPQLVSDKELHAIGCNYGLRQCMDVDAHHFVDQLKALIKDAVVAPPAPAAVPEGWRDAMQRVLDWFDLCNEEGDFVCPREEYARIKKLLAAPAAVPTPIDDESAKRQIGEIGNMLHNLSCEHQNSESLADRLGELANQAWGISDGASSAAPAPAEPDSDGRKRL